MLGFRGLAVPDWLRAFAAEHGLGGVILFDRDVQLGGIRNVESPLWMPSASIGRQKSTPTTLAL